MAFLFKKQTPRKILFVAPEAAPFVKAGGLGEVMFALPRALQKLGHDARLMIPRYAAIDPEKFKLRMEYPGLRVPTLSSGNKDHQPEDLVCNVLVYRPEDDVRKEGKLPVTTYFLENEEYYEKRSNVYGYSDDAVRWNLFSRGVLEFLHMSDKWTPDVIVASDWQMGFLPNYLRTVFKGSKKLSKIATLFMVHNLYYQGMFDHRFVSEMDYDDGKSEIPGFFDERLVKINGMKRGIMYSDMLSTVSPTYAQEIVTRDYGELLDDLLKERRSRIYGILNGIDYEDFNPETDTHLKETYNSKLLDKRQANKVELQDRFGLTKDPNVPIISIVSRFTEQKGLDLLMPVMEQLLRELKFQFVVLGSGDSKYMGYFKDLADRSPGQVSAYLNFDPVLPRVVYGGSDMLLMPSKFEPCGLAQMEAMRYGTVPIVRKTGGLADSVIDFNAATGKGNGFTFEDFNSLSLAITIARACESYKNVIKWKKIQTQAMAANFSWERSAKEYVRVIDAAIKVNGLIKEN